MQDETSTNRTLDADGGTFPLGGERIFAVSMSSFERSAWLTIVACYVLIRQDFSHDNEMIEIITAMNIMPVRVTMIAAKLREPLME